ncbi:MAG: bestrophin family ion channel [Dyadobacter sp.]
MYVKEVFSIWRLLKGIWVGVLAVTSYAAFVFYLYQYENWHFLVFPISIISIVGTALSLLLGFRTNSAYDRWWEARRLWGAIVNDSRSLVRQSIAFIKTDPVEKKAIIDNIAHLQIAWCYALCNTLRKETVLVDANLHLEPEELEFVSKHQNIPNAIILLLERRITSAYDKGYITPILFQSLDTTLARLTDSMGGCERIKNTIFTTQYSFYVHLTIFIFTLILPMGLIDSIGRIAIPITFVISFLFFYVEGISYVMQSPFEGNHNDIPMRSLSRTIEINLLQTIEADLIPDRILPKDGYVM